MSDSVDICVAIPCYNGAAFISQTIEAVLEQSHPPDEILVIDDGSTDDSLLHIAKYSVRLIEHKNNRGLSVARNTAVQNTDCDVLTFVDADAYPHQDMLKVIAGYFDDPSICGVGGQGIEAVQDTIYDIWRTLHASQNRGDRELRNCEHLYGLCMAYRRQDLVEIGGFDVRLRSNGEDMDIGFRLVDAGKTLLYTPAAKVFHQRQDNHESLRRMMHNWYYYGFLVKVKNHRFAWSLALGTLRRMLWSDTIHDLISLRNPKLARLDLELSMVKLKAILAANKIKGTFLNSV